MVSKLVTIETIYFWFLNRLPFNHFLVVLDLWKTKKIME